MAEGHIRLGATRATLREYLLVDPRNYRATSANPMAARVSTGSQYGDLQAWSTFLMADWQAGVGKTSSEAGGFLFSEAETRIPQQVILPAALGCTQIESGAAAATEACFFMPADATVYTTQTVGGTGNPTRISFSVSVYSNASGVKYPVITGVSIYASIANGTGITAALYSDSGGAPNASVASGTLTVTADRPGYTWHYIPLSSTYSPGTLGDGYTTLHWVIYPTSSSDSMTVVQGDGYGGTSHTYDGAAWTENTDKCPFFVYSGPWLDYVSPSGYRLAGPRGFAIDTATGAIYSANTLKATNGTMQGIPRALTLDSVTGHWERTTIAGFTTSVYALQAEEYGAPVVFDGKMYIPCASHMAIWTTGTSTGTEQLNTAYFMHVWGGYLWRAGGNRLYYSNDGTTWVEIADRIGPPDYDINGMAGMGQYLYVATDEALYYVAPGDVAVGLFPWGTIDPDNGRGMVAHQGALYIPVAGRILRYSEDGSIQDIWVQRDDDLNNRRLGKIAALAGLNNWLVAGVNGTTSSDPASVWAFTQQGWHHLASLPPGFEIEALYYDRERSRLWVATDGWAIFYLHAPDWALNPYNDSNSTYMPHGWLEIGRVYGGLRELRKDWESVRLFGELSATGQDVTVYWQDAGTTSWTSLGTATADAQELRWSDYTTRPGGRWLRLGFLLATDDPAETPKIEAVATKLLPMVTDREAWNLAILISDDQEMIDGDINPYTADEMITHLRGLVQQVPPFIFEDVDGTQYEVKAQGSARNIQQYEWLDASQEKRIMWIYEISIEQVTSGTYN